MAASRILRTLVTCAVWAALAAPAFAQDSFFLPLEESGSGFSDPGAEPVARPADEREEFFRPEEDEIETDRDSYTPATTTAGRGRVILESAYTFIDNRNALDTHSFPETMLRFGITKRLELRLHWNYEVGGGTGGVTTGEGEADFEGVRFLRESQVDYGAKVAITEQNGWIPQSAVILLGTTPTSGIETASGFIGTYVFGWKLPNDWKLDAAMRYSADSEEGDSFNVWSPSVVVKVPFARRWNAHLEYIAQFSQNRQQNFEAHYISPGVHYLLSRDLEIGVRVGWGLNQQSANFFANAGLGWRF